MSSTPLTMSELPRQGAILVAGVIFSHTGIQASGPPRDQDQNLMLQRTLQVSMKPEKTKFPWESRVLLGKPQLRATQIDAQYPFQDARVGPTCPR